MDRDDGLMLGILALKKGLLAPGTLVRCAEAWAADPAVPFANLLRSVAGLDAEAVDALTAEAGATRSTDDVSLGSLLADEGQGDSRLDLAPGAVDAAATCAPPAAGAVSIILERPGAERYVLGPEIGRGGLGRVVSARDSVLGREVAVKEMLRGADSPRAIERFLREGAIAGRLSHPNVIPVHDIGVRRSSGRGAGPSAEPGPAGAAREVPYFVMTRIRGRDLRQILRAVERGSWESAECGVSSVENREAGAPVLDTRRSTLDTAKDPRREFTRPRLLRIFQEVCLAVAYAHDHGVIHRDLKPANVMVGEYGEVYVVDWGLAKLTGASSTSDRPNPSDPSDPAVPAPAPTREAAALTRDGDVVGTPAYMSPEQAGGRVAEVDELSDVYSLGAILYEILTLRPPFEGESALNVLAKVMKGEIARPAARWRETRSLLEAETLQGVPAGLPPAVGPLFLPGEVPPDLEEIVLRAMSRDRSRRFRGARELHDEVQAHLEGEKERERRRREAAERVRAGAAHLDRFRSLERDIAGARASARALQEGLPPRAPLEEKRKLWAAQDRVRNLKDERMEEIGRAEIAFGQAVLADPSNPEGHDGRCGICFDRFLAAEAAKDREGMALHRRLLREYDRTGEWLARLERPGSLSLRTFALRCNCLGPRPGLRVAFGGQPVVPWRDGLPRPGEPAGEKDRCIPEVRILAAGAGAHASFDHARACSRESVEGVQVWACRYEESDRRLVPGTPRLVGSTPLAGAALDRGSWLLLLRHPGFGEVRLPVRIDRGGLWEQDLNLYRAGDAPEGFCCVPAGRFLEGGERQEAFEERTTRDFFLARAPVTFAEYLQFLDAIAAGDPEEARRRCPRDAGRPLAVQEGGRWRLPEGAGANPIGLAPEMPVIGVSWFDALAYCAWRSERDGRLYTLPHEEEWEKAARGVDGRRYPWGDYLDESFCKTLYADEAEPRPARPGSFPSDESPYGVQDLAGNVPTWCLNSPEARFKSDRLIRGGAWCFSSDRSAASVRVGLEPETAYRHTGLRLVLRPLG